MVRKNVIGHGGIEFKIKLTSHHSINVQPRKTPLTHNHAHHLVENSSWLKFMNFAMAYVAPDIKNSNIGSNNIYWFSVIIPTSGRQICNEIKPC